MEAAGRDPEHPGGEQALLRVPPDRAAGDGDSVLQQPLRKTSTPNSLPFAEAGCWVLGAGCGSSVNINVLKRNVASIMKLSVKLQLLNLDASAVKSGRGRRLFGKQQGWQRDAAPPHRLPAQLAGW